MTTTISESAATPRTSTDPRRELLDRVLGSSGFAKSGRLSGVLVYLCELTLDGRGEEISEQSIGQEVFGRPANYDSANDGIVRTQISRVRQKLDAYFDAEGVDEEMRIVIPRGGYVPFFIPHAPERKATARDVLHAAPASPSSPVAAPPMVPSPLPKAVSTGGNRQRSVAWAVAAVLALALLAVLVRDAEKKSPAMPRHPLWSQLFRPGESTLIVPADSSLVFWQSLMHRDIDLSEYLTGAFREQAIAASKGMDKTGTLVAGGRYTSIVDVEASSRLSQIALDQKSAAPIRYARDLRPNDLKAGNVVLLGTNEANPWVYLFEKDMNFFFQMDREHGTFRIVNRSPQAGEAREWVYSSHDDRHNVYCEVAYRPNLSGNGQVLILEGTTMAGTECAWDFVSDDSRLLPFLQQIQNRDGSIPYFEVVLGTNNMSGSAVRSAILAWRVQAPHNNS